MTVSHASETDLLRLEEVSRVYRQGEQTVHALRNVNLTIRSGELVAVAGPSGSGKTTLLNVSCGIDQPTDGRVRLQGIDLAQRSRKQLTRLRLERVGFIFQANNLLPVLTVEENAEFILLLRGVPRRRRQKMVRAILEEVGLSGLEDRKPDQLSGGQQQRVAVARAVVAKPPLILADEPTANLDSRTALSLLDLMERLNRDNGTTFIFSTHDPRVMERARRTVRLVDGEVDADERR